jgi:hypothetical protein
LKKLTINIDDPKRVYAIHRASRRHHFQILVERSASFVYRPSFTLLANLLADIFIKLGMVVNLGPAALRRASLVGNGWRAVLRSDDTMPLAHVLLQYIWQAKTIPNKAYVIIPALEDQLHRSIML